MVFNFPHTISSMSFHKMPVSSEATSRMRCPSTVLFPCLGPLKVLLEFSFPTYSMRTSSLAGLSKCLKVLQLGGGRIYTGNLM